MVSICSQLQPVTRTSSSRSTNCELKASRMFATQTWGTGCCAASDIASRILKAWKFLIFPDRTSSRSAGVFSATSGERYSRNTARPPFFRIRFSSRNNPTVSSGNVRKDKLPSPMHIENAPVTKFALRQSPTIADRDTVFPGHTLVTIEKLRSTATRSDATSASSGVTPSSSARPGLFLICSRMAITTSAGGRNGGPSCDQAR